MGSGQATPSETVSTAGPGPVGLVLTGGTIGAEFEDAVLTVNADRPTQAERGLIEESWPWAYPASYFLEMPIRRLSENLRPSDWIEIAAAVRRLAARGVSGVLVLHGTDTMAYSAAALSFLLADLTIPVVLTGANQQSDAPGSDAAANVKAALVSLEHLDTGTYVVFAGAPDAAGIVYLGTHVRKVRASDSAFASVNREIVATVTDGTMTWLDRYRSEPVAERSPDAIDDRVLAVRLYPGLDFSVLSDAVVRGGTRGVVIELYASATGPDTEDDLSVTRFIRRCVDVGIVVVTTVADSPRGETATYETTVGIADAGALFIRNMLPETATVKLMWALAREETPDAVRELMLRPIAGEM